MVKLCATEYWLKCRIVSLLSGVGCCQEDGGVRIRGVKRKQSGTSKARRQVTDRAKEVQILAKKCSIYALPREKYSICVLPQTGSAKSRQLPMHHSSARYIVKHDLSHLVPKDESGMQSFSQAQIARCTYHSSYHKVMAGTSRLSKFTPSFQEFW